jgi:hypothetical protein
LKELKYNEVKVTSDPEHLAFKLLQGLNEHTINTNIYMELSSQPEWYVNITVPEIATKTKKYMKAYTALSNSHCPLASKPTKPAPAPALQLQHQQ